MDTFELERLQEEIRIKSEFITGIRRGFEDVVAGQSKLFDRMIQALLTGGHVLLEGVPGLAKTLAVKTLAQTVDGSFSRVQFTPDLLPADLVGTRIYEAETHTFATRPGPVFANFVLADEINRAPAKVQSALLECMQEHQVTIAGETHHVPDPFMVLATQNPVEQEGTYPLPEAQVDRFMFKLMITYPLRTEEELVVERMARSTGVPSAAQTATCQDIITAREVVDRIYLDSKVLDYILDIVISTRPGQNSQLSGRQQGADLRWLNDLVEFGASPRSAIALAMGARAVAFTRGRAYVVPQDVKEIAHDVLRHRITVSYEAEAENITADAIISRLLEELRTP